jgi:hypothetical protein
MGYCRDGALASVHLASALAWDRRAGLALPIQAQALAGRPGRPLGAHRDQEPHAVPVPDRRPVPVPDCRPVPVPDRRPVPVPDRRRVQVPGRARAGRPAG